MNAKTLCSALFIIGFGCSVAAEAASERSLIDDFATADGTSSLGTRWQAFTDEVMGGRSTMTASITDTEHGAAIRLTGQVRLENNGGFIQARLPLAQQGRLDASDWQGLRVLARGAPGRYALHLRTRHTWRPWQYYSAALPLTDTWQWYEVSFGAFTGESIRRDLDLSQLSSLALVASGEAFEAEIEVAQIEWF
jgi:hypothetical protein